MDASPDGHVDDREVNKWPIMAKNWTVCAFADVSELAVSDFLEVCEFVGRVSGENDSHVQKAHSRR